MSQSIGHTEKQKRIRKKKRKIITRLILLQLVFLAIASHCAQAEPVGIMKYYLLELSVSVFLLFALANIKDKRNRKDEDIIERVIEQSQSTEEPKEVTRVYNYNWVIKDTSKEVEKEKKEESKEDLKGEVKQDKIVYKSPFDAPIIKEKKVKYRSPFEPINQNSVVLVLDSAKDDFCYTLATKDKYKAKVYKKQVDELQELFSQDISTLDVHEINRKAKLILDGVKKPCDVIDKQDKIITCDEKKECHNDIAIIPKEQQATTLLPKKPVNVASKVKLSNNKRYKKVDAIKLDKAKGIDKITYNGEYRFPRLDLLEDNIYENEIDYEKEQEKGEKLIETLASFNVGASILNISHGSSVTRYEILPDAGVKVSKIVNLQDDIALAMAKSGVRVSPVEGKSAIGIEVPNDKVIPVYLKEVLSSQEFLNHKSNLAFGLGKDVTGDIEVGDIEKLPHLLIAGATGSGKSVCLNSIIISILYKSSPKDVRMLMIDPKVVEMGVYNGIPHLLIPVVTEPDKAIGALNWAVLEMESRYLEFAKEKVRDLKGYNKKMREQGLEEIPQILVIIDELADLMMVSPHEIEASITRLAQKARASGIHLIIATQRPSVDVITGLIKANIPSRLSFAVASQIDSRTILDMAGAEKLLGKGDMLYNPIGTLKPMRLKGAFLNDKEVYNVVSYIKDNATTEYKQEVFDIINKADDKEEQDENKDASNEEDEFLRQAIEMVLDYEQASASFIQRKFKVGYARAARILDQMEEWGIVAKAQGSKARQILTTKEEWLELNM